ncbi:LOW QUALITY PROTEIN: dynein axonemal assembly factor 5-like [Phycodurus eques]|uniref:LOW QUALITY PROTEIN: dynein axonemal assembly factor 5-like n=1 Tax=Phycodurus eques TaxID=693459 RepID=UPI002ACD580A|nr:LOW QUALITY PROTEIN: dynein axonemal assembly factor 5-like [Phycodurus eques]
MASTASREKHVSAEVLRGLARHLNSLGEDDKSTRKRALESIKRETVDKKLSAVALQELFSALLKPLLKCLSDPMERCREIAILLISEFIRCVPEPQESLPYLMPCLAQRFGDKELLEPAEELRLSATRMLSLTVEVCGKQLAPYLNEMMNILQRTVVDPFPDVKRESCKCTVNFAKCVPEHFHMQAESLVKPLMQTIAHQHSKVRVSVIEATGTVIQFGTGKNVDDVLSHLAQRLFDDSPQVRKAVTVVVGDWLLNLPDRYSYFHKVTPLLLSSLTDEIPEIRLLAADLWRRVGAQWEKENEDDLKDKMDFLLTPPPFYPPGVERPGLGCRELVVRNLYRLVPAISHDLSDWLVPTRVRTSQLLSVLLLHAEDHSTQHLQPLLALLYRACTDSERDVVHNCLAAAKQLGTFVPPEVFLKLLLDHVNAPSSASYPWSALMVLCAVLGGCPKALLVPHLRQVADTLARPEVCQEYHQVAYLEQLLACVDALLRQCGSDCGAVSLQLLQVLVTVQSLSTEPRVSQKALESTQILCEVQGLGSVTELYRQHVAQLLDWQSASVDSLSIYSPQRLQIHIIVVQSGPVIGEFMSQLMPLLCKWLHPEQDQEMRMNILTMLAKLLLDAGNTLDSQGFFRDGFENFLSEVIFPNLSWLPGRSAAALRTAALSCLLALLHGGAVTPRQVLAMELPLTSGLSLWMKEESPMSRLLACRSQSVVLKLVGSSLSAQTLNRIYPSLLSRLDDSSEDVRREALRALGLWFSCLGANYDTQLCASDLRFVFQQLLLHLDDADGSVQDRALEVLMAGSRVVPNLVKKETEAVRAKHRSVRYCDRLLQHIDSIGQRSTR